MTKKAMKLIVKAAMGTARKSKDSASFFGFYQPKEPVAMKKQNASSSVER